MSPSSQTSRQTAPDSSPERARPIKTAVLLAVGSELTTGETRDTNSGDLARLLSQAGVTVAWTAALPDVLPTVVAALKRALDEADLVVTTGGLGPTPDDLTRESIAAVCGEEPSGRPGAGALGPPPLRAARRPLPRDEHQAGLADPLIRGDPQRPGHGAGLVGGPSGRASDRGPAGAASRDGGDVAARSHATTQRPGPWPGAGNPNLPPDGHRRIGGRGRAGRAAPAGIESRGRHLRSKRRRRRADLGRGRRGSLSGGARERLPSGRSWTPSAATSGAATTTRGRWPSAAR